jgi:hypothetical protein
MATSFTNGNLTSLVAHGGVRAAASRVDVGARRRRIVSRQEGRAIEMLGHAIDYLADEFALDCMDLVPEIGPGLPARLQAIEMLMARNREIYLNCPKAPGPMERLRGWLRWKRG